MVMYMLVYNRMSREINHEYEASHKNGAGPRSLRLKVLGKKRGWYDYTYDCI